MKTYKLVNIKNEYIQLLNQYPSLLYLLYNDSKESYYLHLKNNIFHVINKDFILSLLHESVLYHNNHTYYSIYNDLTNDHIVFYIYDDYIYVHESSGYYYLYHNLKNKLPTIRLIEL